VGAMGLRLPGYERIYRVHNPSAEPLFTKTMNDEIPEQMAALYDASQAKISVAFEAERKISEAYSNTYPDYRNLIWSTHAVLAEVINSLTKQLEIVRISQSSETHGDAIFFAMEIASAIKFMRAADLLYWNGYAYPGLSLIRSIRESVFRMIAIERGLSTFSMFRVGRQPHELIPKSQDDPNFESQIDQKVIMAEEARCYKLITTQNAKLTNEERNALNLQKSYCDTEIHRMQFSFSSTIKSNSNYELQGVEFRAEPAIDPEYDRATAVYGTHANAIRLMLLKATHTVCKNKLDYDEEVLNRMTLLENAHFLMLNSTNRSGVIVNQDISSAIEKIFAECL
jgi:hypothetical protein